MFLTYKRKFSAPQNKTSIIYSKKKHQDLCLGDSLNFYKGLRAKQTPDQGLIDRERFLLSQVLPSEKLGVKRGQTKVSFADFQRHLLKAKSPISAAFEPFLALTASSSKNSKAIFVSFQKLGLGRKLLPYD